MKSVYRTTVLVGLVLLLAACGGGGNHSSAGSGSGSGGGGSGSGGGGGGGSMPTNVTAVTVDQGPTGVTSPTFNIPSVTVTVCEPGTTTCAAIDHVLVDTGSSGLRLMASVLTAKGISLPAEMIGTSTLYECYPFGDGYSWGNMATATVQVGGESTSAAIPIQVINDSATPNPAAPSGCTSSGLVSMNSVNALNANGTIGIGVFLQDCGTACETPNTGNNVYFTCTPTCTSTAVAANQQASNPVASFSADNNGLIVEMQAQQPAGAPTGSGSLIFGIGTQSNNAFGATNVLAVNDAGNFTVSFEGATLPNSFIDSGSNALFFPTSGANAIPTCTGAPQFYCPSNTTSAPLALSATNQGVQTGATPGTVQFSIANLLQMDTSNYALPLVGGPAPPKGTLSSYFDWGLPFFYGRNVYVGLEGATINSNAGPFFAY